VRQRIVDLIANRPDGVTRGQIMDAVYAGDLDGGPSNPNTVSVLIKHANRELAPQGYRIAPTWLGPGARYRLVALASRSPETTAKPTAPSPKSETPCVIPSASNSQRKETSND
jgi:hypothetical protein